MERISKDAGTMSICFPLPPYMIRLKRFACSILSTWIKRNGLGMRAARGGSIQPRKVEMIERIFR